MEHCFILNNLSHCKILRITVGRGEKSKQISEKKKKKRKQKKERKQISAFSFSHALKSSLKIQLVGTFSFQVNKALCSCLLLEVMVLVASCQDFLL